MYVAKVNDRGKAFYTYMFDDQLFEFGDLLSKSYYMKKSSNLHDIVEFCKGWNDEHKDTIRNNGRLYYLNVAIKGILQAPALVVLYAGIVVGMMLLFGSELFHEQVMLLGVYAFGGVVSKIVIIVYVLSAILGILASLSKYDNVLYKTTRSVFSIATFIVISPLFFDRVYFSGSEKAIAVTIILIVGCFFIRVIIDHLLTGMIRKKTEVLIREGHKHYAFNNGSENSLHNGEICSVNIRPENIIDKLRKKEHIKQYKRHSR